MQNIWCVGLQWWTQASYVFLWSLSTGFNFVWRCGPDSNWMIISLRVGNCAGSGRLRTSPSLHISLSIAFWHGLLLLIVFPLLLFYSNCSRCSRSSRTDMKVFIPQQASVYSTQHLPEELLRLSHLIQFWFLSWDLYSNWNVKSPDVGPSSLHVPCVLYPCV